MHGCLVVINPSGLDTRGDHLPNRNLVLQALHRVVRQVLLGDHACHPGVELHEDVSSGAVHRISARGNQLLHCHLHDLPLAQRVFRLAREQRKLLRRIRRVPRRSNLAVRRV